MIRCAPHNASQQQLDGPRRVDLAIEAPAANRREWLEMLRDRNQTSHAYDETLAREIYERVHDNFPELEHAVATLRLHLPPQDSGIRS